MYVYKLERQHQLLRRRAWLQSEALRAIDEAAYWKKRKRLAWYDRLRARSLRASALADRVHDQIDFELLAELYG